MGANVIANGVAEYVSRVYDGPISDVQRREIERAYHAGAALCLAELAEHRGDLEATIGLFAELRRFARSLEIAANQKRWDEMKRRAKGANHHGNEAP